MAYDPTFPADDEYLSEFPAGQREQIRAIVEDTVVNALKLCGLSPGNASGNIPKSNGTRCVNLNADMLDGHDATYFSVDGHTHSAATTSSNGFMSNTDKTKLNGIATGAEVNQNAFANVKVGSTTIQADAKQDTLEMAAGSNIAITPDATNDKVTVAFSGTLPVANGGTGQTDLANVTVGSATKDGNGNNIANTYFPKTGGVIDGYIQPKSIYSKTISGADQKKVIVIPMADYSVIGANTTDADFFNKLLKWICTNYPGETNTTFIGAVRPNGIATVIVHIYDTNDKSNDLPRYSSGVYFGNSIYYFKTDNYVFIGQNVITGAEVNQNAFANVKVGSTTIQADAKQDTLELVAGNNIALTPDATNDKVTIAFDGGAIQPTSILSTTKTNTTQRKVIVIPEVPYNLVSATATDTAYFEGLLKWICTNYPGEEMTTFIGSVYPNGRSSFIAHIYNTSTVSNGLPQYSTGIYFGNNFPKFGTNNYVYSCQNTLQSNPFPASSIAANGYVKLSNGLIIQWGVQTAPTTETSYSVTFPVSFAEACYSMNVSTDLSTHGTSVLYSLANIHPQVLSVSKTGATLFSQHSQDSTNQASRAYWMAIGK